MTADSSSSPSGLSDGTQELLHQDGLRARKMKAPRTIAALLLREMSTTYGRSPGGYAWAILEPVAAIAVLSIGFSLLFRTPALGTNFPLFFATGYLPLNIYQLVARNTTMAIRFNRSLLAYPTVTYADAIIARFLLSAVTQSIVMVVVLTGIHVIYDLRPILDFQSAILAATLAAALGLAVGSFNCYLTAIYPIWENIWGIVSRPLFLISGVIFTYEAMPVAVQNVLWYNPLLQVVGLNRQGFYGSYRADYVSLPYIVGFTMLVATFGFLLLYRHNRTVLNA